MSETEEIQNLGNMLTATTIEDTERLRSLIETLTSITNASDVKVPLTKIAREVAEFEETKARRAGGE